jgi:hypothetical protein
VVETSHEINKNINPVNQATHLEIECAFLILENDLKWDKDKIENCVEGEKNFPNCDKQ